MLSVTHQLYAMKFWVTWKILSAMYAVCAYRCTYMPKHKMPLQRQKDVHAIVATCRETETRHMHNMAGQQAKA